jgi:hypothetical protein
MIPATRFARASGAGDKPKRRNERQKRRIQEPQPSPHQLVSREERDELPSRQRRPRKGPPAPRPSTRAALSLMPWCQRRSSERIAGRGEILDQSAMVGAVGSIAVAHYSRARSACAFRRLKTADSSAPLVAPTHAEPREGKCDRRYCEGEQFLCQGSVANPPKIQLNPKQPGAGREHGTS